MFGSSVQRRLYSAADKAAASERCERGPPALSLANTSARFGLRVCARPWKGYPLGHGPQRQARDAADLPVRGR